MGYAEAEALRSLVAFLESADLSDVRTLNFVDSRVILGAVAKWRSSSRRLNYILRKLAAHLLRQNITLELVWLPSWANSSDVPAHFFPLADWGAGRWGGARRHGCEPARPHGSATCENAGGAGEGARGLPGGYRWGRSWTGS